MNKKQLEQKKRYILKKELLSEEEFSLLEEIVDFWNQNQKSGFIIDKSLKRHANHLNSRGYISYNERGGIRPTWNMGVPLYLKIHPDKFVSSVCLLPDSRGPEY